MLALILELLSTMLAMKYLACNLTLGLGSFMFALSFAKDLIAQLHSMNECIHAKEPKANILTRLSELIDLQADVHELSVQCYRLYCTCMFKQMLCFSCMVIFSEVFEIPLAILFLVSSATICTSMSIVQIALVKFFYLSLSNSCSFQIVSFLFFLLFEDAR